MSRQLWPDDHIIKYYLYFNLILMLHKFIQKCLRKELICEMVCTSLFGRVYIACAIWCGNDGDIIENIDENVRGIVWFSICVKQGILNQFSIIL